MSGKTNTILVAGEYADDHKRLVTSLCAELFNVLSVKTQDSAMTLARSEVPTLIILDFKSSFDLCRMLKRSFVTEHIPIILLLTSAEEVDRVVSFELGVDDCLAKPFNFRELLLRIRCSLRRARDNEGRARFKRGQHYATLTKPASVSELNGENGC